MLVHTRVSARAPHSEKSEPTIREKIAAEQSGEPVVASHKFEAGASLAASILARFTGENAETQLVIGRDASDFGGGRQHFHESLKRLALAAPDRLQTENLLDIERILNEADDSHLVLVTANGEHGLPPELLQRLKIIRF